jgi:hypothetical protein
MARRIVLGLTALVLSALPLAASTFVHMSPEELVAGSDAVIRGRVVEVHSFWDAAGKLIHTEALVRVDERLIGEAAGFVTLRTVGGTVGSYTVEAHGFPEFRQNESLIAFIKQQQDGTARIVGYREGQFRVMRSPEGRVWAMPMVEGRYLTKDGRQAPPARAVTLEEFRDRVRDIGRRQGRVR